MVNRYCLFKSHYMSSLLVFGVYLLLGGCNTVPPNNISTTPVVEGEEETHNPGITGIRYRIPCEASLSGDTMEDTVQNCKNLCNIENQGKTTHLSPCDLECQAPTQERCLAKELPPPADGGQLADPNNPNNPVNPVNPGNTVEIVDPLHPDEDNTPERFYPPELRPFLDMENPCGREVFCVMRPAVTLKYHHSGDGARIRTLYSHHKLKPKSETTRLKVRIRKVKFVQNGMKIWLSGDASTRYYKFYTAVGSVIPAYVLNRREVDGAVYKVEHWDSKQDYDLSFVILGYSSDRRCTYKAALYKPGSIEDSSGIIQPAAVFEGEALCYPF